MTMFPRPPLTTITSLVNTTHLKTKILVVLIVLSSAIAAAMAVTAEASPLSAFSSLLMGVSESVTGGSGEQPGQTSAKASSMLTALPQSSAGLNSARRGHTATRLGDGRVLIAGGENSSEQLSGTEIFDPSSGTFSIGGNMSAARADHAAIKLGDGRVLISGGRDGSGTLSTTEYFDPSTGTFSSGPAMSVARAGHSATLFADGRVFIAGGEANGSAEIFDPSSGTFSAISAQMNSARSKHSSALLLDGRVLVVGGRALDGSTLNSVEIFDPADSSFSPVDGSLAVARVLPLLRVLFDGKVQIIGGSGDGSMEIYDPLVETIGAYAHVIPETDPCVGLSSLIMASPTRAALFHNGQTDALLDRTGQTITELPGSIQALVAGGVNSNGAVLDSSSVLTSSLASISTDKMDYTPGDTATITGRGFQPGETVRLKIHEDPHTPQERGFDITADAEGNFSGTYLVQVYDSQMKFIVGARGLSSGWTAQTTFTDANENIEGWQNLPTASWGGTLNGSNSNYAEGNVIPIRFFSTDAPGSTHNVVLKYDFSNGSDHFVDFLTSYNQNPTVTPGVDPCIGKTPCVLFGTIPIPTDGTLPFQIPGVLTAYNVSSISFTSGYSLTSGVKSISLTYTVTTGGSAKPVVLAFGAHLARENEWGTGNGADSFPGASGKVYGAIDGGSDKNVSINPNAINPTADLSITKIDSPDPVNAGDPLTYTITVNNLGPQQATAATVTDVIPAGLTVTSATWTKVSPAGSGACAGTTTRTCALGALNAGSSGTVTIVATVAANTADGTVITNTATVAGTPTDPVSSNNSSTTTTTVKGRADVSISKTDNPDPVSAGSNLTYTITVTNTSTASNGSTAKGISVSDPLPANTLVSATGSAGVSCSGTSTVTCSVPDLAPGASATITIVVAVSGSASGALSNTATVTTTTFDPNTANNSDTETTDVAQNPDVHVTKTADASPISSGDTAAYTIVVNNSGPGQANSVTLSDPLPSGVNWTEDSPDCSISGTTLSCNFGNLANGASKTIHVTGTTSANNCGTLSNTATVAATNEPVANQGDNSSTASIVVQCPDISTTKTADAATVSSGDQIGFTITVSNSSAAGTGTAKGVTLSDTLPTGLTWNKDGANEADCTIGANLSCTFGDLAPGASKTVHIFATTSADNCGLINNSATASATNERASDTANNTGTASVTVQCPNISTTKTADAATVSAGDQIGFTITVSNSSAAGTGTAKGVTLSDTLPTGLTWNKDGANEADCAIGANLSCTFGDLAPGASKTVHIFATTSADNCGLINNSATASATNERTSDTANNTGNASVTVQCPDIKVEKTADASPINAGDTAAFTIVVSNLGPGVGRNVTLSDTLPAGVVWNTVSAGCSITGGNSLSCSFGDLSSGDSRTVNVSGQTDAADCSAALNNTATAAADNEASGTLANNTSSASITVQCPDIKVEKTADTSSINAGDTAAFTIVVSNLGPGVGRNVTLSDTLPAGVVWSTSSAGCSITGGNSLSCSFGDLNSGDSRTVNVSGQTDAADCSAALNNTATAAADNEASTTLANNSSSASITVQCPDIKVEKTADASTINAGDTAAFTIVVSNLGPGVGRNVTLSDTLPAGVVWNTSSAGCSITGGTSLSCSFGDLNAGDSRTVNVSGQTDSADCSAALNNTATASADNEASTTLANNSSSASITVQCPDIKVEKTADASTINAGDTAAFTIVVSNLGPGVGRNVTLSDTLPAGVVWNTASAGCSITGGNSLSCSFGDLNSGDSRTVNVSGQTDAADCSAALNNTATASADNEAAGTLGNNSSSASITVQCPDIKVEKTADASPISAGDTAAFTIVVSNLGPGVGRNVTLSDTLPAEVVWNTSSAGCSITGGTSLSCSFGDLNSGDSRTVNVSGQTDAADCSAALNNTATASADNEASTTLANNSSSASITVQCPDIKVEKTADASPINAGDTAAFTIVVSNLGPGVGRNVTLSDTLPAGVVWNTSSAGCSITGGNSLSCSFGDLNSGDSRTVNVSGRTDAADCSAALNNTATAAADNEASGTLANNTSSASITVQCPDIKVEKTADASPINAGDTAAFTIVVSNLGPGVGRNVTLSDTLPAGVVWNTSSAGCSITGGTSLSCSFGDLNSGDSRTVNVSGQTDATDCSAALNNTATAAADNEAAGTLSNNSSSASITVQCPDIKVEKTADASPINAGDTAAFTIVVSNLGPGVGRNVTLSDTLPAGVVWNTSSAGCSITGGNSLSCSFGDLNSGDSRTVNVSGQTDAADCSAALNNTATAAADNEASGTLANNTSSASITVQCPDIKVEKTADASPISAGDTAAFTIVVSNLGPGVGRNVTLSDTLPAGVVWNTASAGCSITGGNSLSCSFGDLNSGDSRTVNVSGQTDAADCSAALNNTATASADNEAAGTLGNNSSSASITVQCPDIKVEKTADASPISAGDTAAFTIVVSNLGPGVGRNVTLSDTLPAGVVWNTSSAGCSITGGNSLSCSFGDLNSGDSRTVNVSGQTDAADCSAALNNTATAAADNEAAGTLGNNSSSASITVQCPDIKVEKTADASPISAGDTAAFTIVVSNLGPGVGRNVTLSDTLPAGVVWNTASAGCSITGGNSLSCSFGDLNAGDSRTVNVSGQTDATDCSAALNNTATASADNEAAGTLGNNSSSASITVQCPDIKVEKTADASTINAGDTAAFTIVVSNLGPGVGRNVTLSDTLPAGVVWNTASAGCSITGGNSLSCSFGDLNAGDSRTVNVSGQTDATDCSAALNNTATASADNEAAGTLGNNSSSASITVQCPDIKVEKTADASPINAGDTAAFTIVVSNLGPGVGRNVTLSDTLPAGVVWNTASAGCSITGGNSLSCSFGDLNSGDSRTVNVSGQTDASDCSAALNNTATAAADNEAAGTLGNNSSSASITVQCPDIKVEKTADASPISAGDTAAFTIVVSNLGPGVGRNVTLSDTLPAGVVWNTASAGCSITGGTSLSCSFGDLNSGDSRTVNVSGQTDAADCSAALNNTATASADNEAAGTLSNNSSSASITVQCPDIKVEKTADASTINAGDTAAFTIVVSNLGPGVGRNVTLSDTLPAGVVWNTSSAGCSITGGNSLSCSFGDLNSGDPRTVNVSGQTDAADCSAALNNTATASADNEASTTLANNSSSASITVQCPDIKVEKTADASTINAGDTAAFTIVVSNLGPGVGRNVTLSDTLPAGVVWNTSSAGCSITGGNSLSCSFGDLNSGDSRTVNISGQTDAADCSAALNNTATASADNEASTTLANNSSSASISVQCPDIKVEKTADASPISAGDTAAFTIVVSNLGPGVGRNVTLSDTLPAGVIWNTASAGCSITGGNSLSCSFGDLNSGDSRTVNVSGQTDAADCSAALNNTATASADNEASTTLGNNSSSASITVQCPDIKVEKTADASPISAGDTAAFTIVVSNLGPGVGRNVTLSDTLPAGVVWNTSSAGCSITGGNSLSCSFGDLNSGDSRTVNVSGQTDAADCSAALNNTATASADNEAAGTLSNNSSSASITVQCPDIKVEKTADASPINAGDTAAFTIVVSNLGPGVGRNVTLSDTLPAGVVWNTASAGCSITGGTSLSCSFGDLNSGDSRTVNVSGQTDAADCSAALNNTATASADNEAAGTLSNNSSSASITVQCPDIKVEKTADASPINAGDTAAFTIVVSNLGPGVGRNVTLSDTLSAGVVWNTSSAGCSITGGNSLSCSFGDLNSGDSRTVNISGQTDAADCSAALNNTATAAADNEAAGTLGNNSSSASITVQCPDIKVTKTPDAATVTATDGIGFTITVSNIGAGTAKDVTLSDTLPSNAGLTWSESPNIAQCGISGTLLTCNFGTLGSGASASVHIASPTTPDTCGTVTNTATAAASNERSADTANNSSTASITVLCPDVVVAKVADSPTVPAGNPIGFTITVTNSGPGVAKNVTLNDSLPMNPGMSWTEVPDNPSCSISLTGVLTCSFGNLATGDVKTVHVVSPTTPANCGSVSNTATAAATNERSTDTANNSSTASIILQDVTAPVITLIPNMDITFWSPNHKYNTVRVTDFVASVSDSCSTSLPLSAVYIWKVTSDEPENINSGDGNTFKDMIIANDCKSVDLRAERDGSKNGRVYTIFFKVQDAAGNIGTAQAKVKVPKSQGINGAAVEDAVAYTVTNTLCP